MKQQLIFLSFLSVLMFGIGFVAGRWITDPASVSEIKYVDRFLPPVSEKYSLPSSKLIYLPITIEKTRVDTVRIPKEITKYVVADTDKSIKVKPSTVAFTYFDPTIGRFGTNTYTIPNKNVYFTAGVDGTYAFTQKTYNLNIWGGFGVKKATFLAGYAINPQFNYPYVGIRYTFFD